MSQKALHITFGFSGKAILVQSNLIDLKNAEIVTFTDPLSEGPLCGLDETEAIRARKQWMEKVLGPIASEGSNNFVDDNLTLLKQVIAFSDQHSHIYLWLGDDANEKITTARLLFYLKKLSTPIYKLNFHRMDFRDEQGEKLNLHSLQMMSQNDISEAAKHFELLNEYDMQSYASLWMDIRAHNAVINQFDNAGKHLAGDETFFDEYLLKRCSETAQNSSLTVAFTLSDIWDTFNYGSVDESFLYYRLKELAHMDKLEISSAHENPERAKIAFDVRKKN